MLNKISPNKNHTHSSLAVWLICFQSQWWESDNCFKNSEATVKIENYCFLSWPNIKHSAHLMTPSLHREEASRTVKSQQISSVWVWRSRYGLTEPIQFTSSMDSTRSENRQPGIINRTPTVKPAFHSSSGKEKETGTSEEKGIRVQAARGNASDCLHGNQGQSTGNARQRGRNKGP